MRGTGMEPGGEASLAVSSSSAAEGMPTMSSKNALAFEGGVRRDMTRLERDERVTGTPNCGR